MLHPDIVNFNVAELNKDWLKSEVWNKKWTLVTSIIFSLCLDIFVGISDKPNDLISNMGLYGRWVTLFLLVVLYRLIYQTEGKIETEKKYSGPYKETQQDFDENYKLLKNYCYIYYGVFQTVILLHQLSHEIMDPNRDMSDPHNIIIKVFFMSTSIFTGAIFMIFLNINTLFSMALLVAYIISLIVYIFSTAQIRKEIGFTSIGCTIALCCVSLYAMYKMNSSSKQIF